MNLLKICKIFDILKKSAKVDLKFEMMTRNNWDFGRGSLSFLRLCSISFQKPPYEDSQKIDLTNFPGNQFDEIFSKTAACTDYLKSYMKKNGGRKVILKSLKFEYLCDFDEISLKFFRFVLPTWLEDLSSKLADYVSWDAVGDLGRFNFTENLLKFLFYELYIIQDRFSFFCRNRGNHCRRRSSFVLFGSYSRKWVLLPFFFSWKRDFCYIFREINVIKRS